MCFTKIKTSFIRGAFYVKPEAVFKAWGFFFFLHILKLTKQTLEVLVLCANTQDHIPLFMRYSN